MWPFDMWRRKPSAYAVEAATPNSADKPENDRYWRKIGGTSRNIASYDHRRACDDSVRAFQRDGFARRAIRMQTGFVVGATATEPQVIAESAELREELDEHVQAVWHDDRNQMPCRLPQWSDALGVMGELFIPVFPDEASRFVSVGYLDPSLISAVVCNPGNSQQRVCALSNNPVGTCIAFPIIGPDMKRFGWFMGKKRGDSVVIPRQAPGGGDLNAVVGPDIFYLAVNDIPGQSRGIGDLYPALDDLDLHDRIGFSSAERAENLAAFSWALRGSDTTSVEDLKKVAKSLQRRIEKGSGLLVAYKGADLSAVAPQIQAADWVGIGQMMENRICTTLGLPRTWLVDPSSATFAADGANAPVLTALQERQTVFRVFVEQLLTFIALQLPAARAARDEDRKSWRVELPLPVIVGKDTMRESAVLVSDLNALATAESEGYLSKAAAQRFAADALTSYGFTVRDGDQPDPEEVESRSRFTPLPFPTRQSEPNEAGKEGGRGEDDEHQDAEAA